MKKIFKPIVLAILASTLAVVSCTQDNRTEIDGIKSDIAALKEKIAAGEVDVKAQISSLQFLLQSYKDEINPKLNALDAQLKIDYAALAAADEDLNKALKEAQNNLQAMISKNANDISATNKELEAAVAEYKKLVAAAVADFEAAIAKIKEDQANTDAAQNAAILALGAQVEVYKTAIEQSIEELQATVIALGAALGAVQDDVIEVDGSVKELEEKVDANYVASIAYTDALKAAVKATTDALEKRIKANEDAIEKLNKETIPELEMAILALQTAIADLGDDVDALDQKKLDKATYEAFLKEYNTWKSDVDTKLEGLDASVKLLVLYDGMLADQITTLTNIVDLLNGDETIKGSVKQQLKAVYESIIAELTDMQAELEAELKDLQEEVKEIKGDLEAAQIAILIINGKISEANAEIVKTNGRIDDTEKLIATIEKAINDKIAGIEIDITGISSALAALNGAVTSVKDDVTSLQEAKDALEKDVEQMKADIVTLKTDVNNLNTALLAKEAELKALIKGVSDKVDIINGDKDTVGSIAYAIDQYDQAIQANLATLAGRVAKNEDAIKDLYEEVGKLAMRIQSLVFVPEYKDLCFGVPFTGISDGSLSSITNAYNDPNDGFTVIYKVAPAGLAEILAEKVTEEVKAGIDPIFAFDIVTGLKSSTLGGPQLHIMKAEGDDETGRITFHLSHEGFNGSIMDTYAVSLRADNDEFGVHVASEYVQTALRKESFIEIDKTRIYKANPLTQEAEEVLAIDPSNPEMSKEIEYTDGIAYAYFAGFELGAKLTIKGEEKGVYTLSQLKAMGYDMPTPKTTVECTAGTTACIVDDLSLGAASTVSVKIKDGTEDNMKKTKKAINSIKEYTYAFNDGLGDDAANTVYAQLIVKIGRHKSAIAFSFPYETVWTYADDAVKDNNNYLHPDALQNYVRSSFVVNPALSLPDGDYPLDGSNKVYGLEVTDFELDQVFTTTDVPADIVPAFKIVGIDDTDKELALEKVEIKKRVSDTYSVKGTYAMSKYLADAVANVPTTVTVKWTDRKTDDILINLTGKEVTLLKTGEFVDDLGDGYYTIKSDDFADALMTAYVSQGIFTKTGDVFVPTKETAFGAELAAEFNNGNISEKINAAYGGRDKSFVVLTNEIDHEFYIKSDDAEDKLTSKILHKVSTNYENLPWTYSFTTYVGQKVTVTWPISAKFMYDYKFKTFGLNTTDSSFTIPDSNVWPDHANITKAKTELDLLYDSNILVMEGNTTVPSADIASKHLAPKFVLVGTPAGVSFTNSNLLYYGQAPSVGIKSSLDLVSGNTPFLVPGSDKMYVNNTSNTVETVYVKQFNPIADPDGATESVTVKLNVASDIPVTMKDILGNKLYVSGVRTTTEAHYKATIPEIFGLISFSVYSVNGSTVTTGWTIATPYSPEKVQLHTAATVATGTYNVVVKATTQWKTYDYNFVVTVEE
jgi:predicted  nucleic acid-binding Zn-ribbon protein